MRRRFSFHPRAEEELNEVAAYYEAESDGLPKGSGKRCPARPRLSRIRSIGEPPSSQKAGSKIPVQPYVLGHSERHSDTCHRESETAPLLLAWAEVTLILQRPNPGIQPTGRQKQRRAADA